MDIEKLIERMNNHLQSLAAYSDPELAHTLEDAATTLSTLRAENEKLRAELEEVKRVLAMMWYAYENKDGEAPHEYEIEARRAADKVLGPWEECMPKYLRRGQKED